MNSHHISILEDIYHTYSRDIENHAQDRHVSENSKYTMQEFKEYQIGYSKKIIDEIDDFIGPLYGLTKEEIEFIKNYEIEFRMADYLSESELSSISGMSGAEAALGKTKTRCAAKLAVAPTVRDCDDEELE